jgi:hypothetical protein
VADFVEWGKLKPKTGSEMASGPGFSITINLPSTANSAQQTIVLEAPSPKNTPEIEEKTPILLENHVPIVFSEAEDYEYAGEDYF